MKYKNCKNCNNFRITKNGREICALRPKAQIISVLCCKEWKQAHARENNAHTRKYVKQHSIKHYTLT